MTAPGHADLMRDTLAHWCPCMAGRVAQARGQIGDLCQERPVEALLSPFCLSAGFIHGAQAALDALLPVQEQSCAV